MAKLPTLSRNNEFQRVYAKGRYVASKSLVIYLLPNRRNKLRFGITTSKKVGNSVTRNRLRRLIRENLRLMRETLGTGADLVVVARKADKQANLNSIGKEMRHLLARLGFRSRDTDG